MAKTGLGLRTEHYHEVLTTNPPVPWFEVITENFLGAGGSPRSVLEKVRQNYPIAFHGVSLSIGSLDPLDKNYLFALKKMVQEIDPWLVSDHLSWSRHRGVQTHDLLPILYTQNNLLRIAERVHQVQEVLGRPLALENPSLYVWSDEHEMRESEFFAALTQMTGCGILLDLNNLIVNWHNLGIDPQEYLKNIASCDVRQLHIAGHTISEHIRIDTHDQAPSPEAMALLIQAAHHWPEARPLLEWDAQMPPFKEFLKYAQEIDFEIATGTCPWPPMHSNQDTNKKPLAKKIATEPIFIYHDRFLDLIYSPQGIPEEPQWQEWIERFGPTASGLRVYNSGFFMRALSALENIFPRLKKVCGDSFAEIARAYLQKYKPSAHTIDFVGRELPAFLAETTNLKFAIHAPPEFLVELATFENARNEVFWAKNEKSVTLDELAHLNPADWAEIRFCKIESCQVMNFQFNTREIVAALDQNLEPSYPQPKGEFVAVFRAADALRLLEISAREFRILSRLSSPTTLTEIVGNDDDFGPQEEILNTLRLIVEKGWLTYASDAGAT